MFVGTVTKVRLSKLLPWCASTLTQLLFVPDSRGGSGVVVLLRGSPEPVSDPGRSEKAYRQTLAPQYVPYVLLIVELHNTCSLVVFD